jgi:hypothetical protein
MARFTLEFDILDLNENTPPGLKPGFYAYFHEETSEEEAVPVYGPFPTAEAARETGLAIVRDTLKEAGGKFQIKSVDTSPIELEEQK